MDSMEVLCQLRDQKAKREKAHRIFNYQIDKINELQEEKKALLLQLEALKHGERDDDAGLEDDVMRQSKLKLVKLKEKILAYKTIGPCGLTVMDAESDSLAVSFTGCYKQQISETFRLKIDCSNGARLSGTTIPYFINVQEILDKENPVDWNKVINKISRLISAYTSRKGDIEEAKTQFKSYVKSVENTASYSFVNLTLDLPEEEKSYKLRCQLTYSDLEAVCNSKVQVQSDSEVFPEEVLQEVQRKFLSTPLTMALKQMINPEGSTQSLAHSDLSSFQMESDHSDNV